MQTKASIWNKQKTILHEIVAGVVWLEKFVQTQIRTCQKYDSLNLIWKAVPQKLKPENRFRVLFSRTFQYRTKIQLLMNVSFGRAIEKAAINKTARIPSQISFQHFSCLLHANVSLNFGSEHFLITIITILFPAECQIRCFTWRGKKA